MVVTSTPPQPAWRHTNGLHGLSRLDQRHASTFAKRVLEQQLRVAGVLPEGEWTDSTEFLPIFRNAWADHADYVSNVYSGSGDFTRTGVRTRGGAMRDGMNSVTRYLKNNYFDGPRLDAFDLMAGA
ncbi:hypothetical protein FRC07_013342 [Ceratobasidium sp. 392]|nr:hypothetical protein FRC07_013342 [Ceratobasidium sp. 392]